MQLFSNSKQDFIPLGNLLGLFYQIRDDYVNLVDSQVCQHVSSDPSTRVAQNETAQYMKNKGYLEDLTEGKFSFPIIHCILADPSDTRLLSKSVNAQVGCVLNCRIVDVLRQRTESIEVKCYAREWMIQNGSLDFTRRKLLHISDQIKSEVERLGGNSIMSSIIMQLGEIIHSRPAPQE